MAYTNQIGHLDEPLEPGVVFDVEAVEGDAVREVRRRWVDEVADLVAVDVDGQDDVAGLGHELLAEVGADEAAGADHADGEGRDGVAVQIQAGGRRRRRHPPWVPRRCQIGRNAGRRSLGSEAMSVAASLSLPIFKASLSSTSSSLSRALSEKRQTSDRIQERSLLLAHCSGCIFLLV
jgi:hypothetical protein